tara:strand:+ start:1845 stop:2588 length:744 start_codon:yes stop_codon:yes gene_type:complete
MSIKQGFKAVILPDVHIHSNGYDKVYDVAKNFVRNFKPDKVYLLGDFADCRSLSHWDLDKKRKIDGDSHRNELDVLGRELDYLQKYSKEVIWLAGNHEHWVDQYLDNHPEVEGLIEYPKLLRLKERGIKWVPYNDLYKVGQLYMTHGMYAGEHHAKMHLTKLGCNVVYGHVHRSQVYSVNMVMQKSMKAYGLGCLCNKKPAFLRGKAGSWDHQLAVLYVASNGEFNLYPIDIINHRFYFNGKSYGRK